MFVMLTIIVTLILLTVFIHMEGLWYIQRGAEYFSTRPRTKVAVVVAECIALHAVEIGLYALAYIACDRLLTLGDLVRNHQLTPIDYLYFSAETFTALGYGDIVVSGNLRFLAAMEPLNGLTLLSWSGAFTFLAMQRYWDGRGG